MYNRGSSDFKGGEILFFSWGCGVSFFATKYLVLCDYFYEYFKPCLGVLIFRVLSASFPNIYIC